MQRALYVAHAEARWIVVNDTGTQDQFAFTQEGKQWTFQRLSQGYLNSPTPGQGLVAQNLTIWAKLHSVSLFYIDGIVVISDCLADLKVWYTV